MLARDAAEAELELARVRAFKVALIERVAVVGRFESPKLFRSPEEEDLWMKGHYLSVTPFTYGAEFTLDALPAMPPEEPQRTAEAIRRALPHLLRLQRYEGRAIARRNRAIRALAESD